MKRTLVILMTLVPVFLFTQEFGKVSGKVVADGNNKALAGASVVIEGTALGSSADANGEYTILGVPVGTYALRADYIGYQSVKILNITVSENLTSNVDFAMKVSAVKGDLVEIIAEKPLINENTTNTTRIVNSETIEHLPLRGVESVVALQTGTVADDDNIYVRGSRSGDVAYYVDGVYMNNSWDLENTSTVSNAAMEEVQFQSGGFSAEYGNVNGGVVSTTTKTGSDIFALSGEFVTGLGKSSASADKGLYSYGYNLYNVSLGGPLPNGFKYFVNFEGRTTDDRSPSHEAHYTVDRDEITWGGISKTVAFEGTDEEIVYWTGDLMINNTPVTGWDEHLFDLEDGTEVYGSDESLNNIISNSLSGHYEDYGLDGYNLVDVTKVSRIDLPFNSIDNEDVVIAGYDNFQKLYGPKINTGSERTTFNGNLLFELSGIRFKVGGLINNETGNYYRNEYSLVNSAANERYEEKAVSMFANMTYTLSPESYIKFNVSSFNYTSEEGDDKYWDNYNNYGQITANSYLGNYGTNPLAIQGLSNYTGFGSVYDDYSINKTSYVSLKSDYLNQVGNHEIKAGFDYRKNEIKYYRVAQPLEIAERYHLAEEAGTTIDNQWIYLAYMNAYTENLGYSITGKSSGVAYQDPGEPIIFGMYVQDKIELEDMIVNFGIRYDYFDANTKEAADWNDIWLTDGRIDRDLSNYRDVDSHTYINPRIGFSFPVTDQTKFHAQYGKFSQHPILNRLYLADSRLAANLTQGNMTVSPNPSLKPERTTQYEVGFTQQVGDFAALDITGFYKEIRDYTMMANLTEGMKNGSPFSWAQYMNGDFGVVKGLSLNLNMRRVNGLMANASYTLSFAQGTGSDPASNWDIAWTGDTYPTLVNPLEYDQRHTGSIMLDYRLGEDGGLLANTGVNTLFVFGSGTAFTPSQVDSDVFGRGWNTPTAAINSAYKPWTYSMDVKIDRNVKVGAYNANIYLWITNFLDTKNVDEVFPGTGDAGSDGYLSTREGKVWATGNPDTVDFYNAQLRDPQNWDAPRQVRLGVNVEL